MPRGDRPLRVLTLTTLFPNAAQPRNGIFVANRLRRLCDTGRIEARVVAAVPRFPGAYAFAGGVPEAESWAGIPVRHPRYFHIPAVGMRAQPDSLARALYDDVARSNARYDLVDAHYFYPDGVAAAIVASRLKLPFVISARGSDINLIGRIGFARTRMIEAANDAAALIAVSSALAREMARLGMPSDQMHVLRNGVDLKVFSPMPKAEARRRLGLDPDGALVLAVGNLVPEKGFDLLIDAIALLPSVKLLLIGEGPLRQKLARRAAVRAGDRIAFRENMPHADLHVAYAAADVLGLPSLREGWPNVVLEAMACGTPVAAAAVGGVLEMLGQGAPGIVVQERSPRAWAAALQRLVGEPLDAAVVRSHASRFSWDEVVSAQCALYERIVRTRTSVSAEACA